jgi:hypothetical protein
MRYARLAAVLAGSVSVGLIVVVVERQVGFNLLNGWTIVLGLVACVVLAEAERPHDAAVGAGLLSSDLRPRCLGA